jgi:hypothetical protein
LYHILLICSMENSFINHPLLSHWEHHWFNPPSNESSSLEVCPSLKWTVYSIIYEWLSAASRKQVSAFCKSTLICFQVHRESHTFKMCYIQQICLNSRVVYYSQNGSFSWEGWS